MDKEENIMDAEPLKSIVDMSNRELIIQLIKKTNGLPLKRFELLTAMSDLQNAKEDLALQEAFIVRDVANEGTAKNPETRKSELRIKTEKHTKFQEALKARNEAWHQTQVQEALIEKLQQDITNLRTVLNCDASTRR